MARETEQSNINRKSSELSEENAVNAEQNSENEAYQPAPRGMARVLDVDIAAIDERLRECGDYFTKHCDEADYRNLDWYQWRMQLRFAAGDDVYEVIDDAFLAARCLHERHAMHLELKPPEMFMTRRITPVELGIISGMPMLTLEFSATYGLPLMMVLGNTAPEDVMSEANLMTSYFRRGFCADFAELTGLSAVIYAGVIAAIGRGFDDEATLGLNTYAKARDSLRGRPPASLLPKIKRYDALNSALACLCAGKFELIGEILAPEAEAFLELQRAKNPSAFLSPQKMPPPKYFDTAILTIIALAVLRGEILELPETGVIAAYRDFIQGLTQIPERRIEVPGLDEESRRILQEAGIDPDNIGGNEADQSFHHAKEESESRAAAIFEEKQRLAQEAVKEKLAHGVAEEDRHTAVDPDDLVPEKLRLREDENQIEEDSAKYKKFKDFFNSEETSEAENTPVDDALPEAKTKDFSAFFDSDTDSDADRRYAENLRDEAPEEKPKPVKDFSDFFSQDDETDASIRAHVEEENSAVADSGKSYATFFDNLDEAAIPKFDDGSNDRVVETPVHTSYSADFFSDDKPVLSGLKMTLDEPETPKAKAAEEPETKQNDENSDYVPSIEDNSPRRDFTKLFDESIPAPTIGLKMSDDAEENAKCYRHALEHDKSHESFGDASDDAGKTGDNSRDFSKFFDGEARQDLPTQSEALDARDAQIRELEIEQARREREIARQNQALKLTLDASDAPQFTVRESYQQRMERLMAEKHQQARERALKEREEAMRELEEMKKAGPAKMVVEALKLTPDVPSDPDDAVQKVDPEDLVIKGFAYDDLDRIHANTAQKAEVEDDFDLHAALHQNRVRESSEAEKRHSGVETVGDIDDDDLHVVVDYDAMPTKDSSHSAHSDSKNEEN